jgi:SAM-dependent methyltransferase
MSETIKSYANLAFHRKISELIKEHSENKEDIRNIAKNEIKWDNTHTLLDLGCGYGWFEEGLEEGLDLAFGIDCLDENKAGFLKAAEKIAKKAIFERIQLPSPIEMPPDSFDLIVSAYSLYFFSGAISEVKRLLCPEGVFLVITHSESMLIEGEDFFNFSNLREVIRHFSAENGETILKKYFSKIISIDYPNALMFTKNDSSHLAQYIDFKKEFISKDVNPEIVREKMLAELKERGNVKFNKDDRIFIAKK